MRAEQKLIVYHKRPSRSNRVLWVLGEIGVEAREVEIDLFKGEQKKPDYLAIHPQGLVPALAIGERSMFESAAIVMFLADRYPKASLAPPPGSDERASYYQWCVYGPAEIDHKLSTLNVHTLFSPPEQRDQKAAASARSDFNVRGDVLSKVLRDRPFLLGDRFSAADIVIGHACAWAKMLDVLDEFPVLVSYLGRLEERSAFERVYGGKVQRFPDPYAR